MLTLNAVDGGGSGATCLGKLSSYYIAVAWPTAKCYCCRQLL